MSSTKKKGQQKNLEENEVKHCNFPKFRRFKG